MKTNENEIKTRTLNAQNTCAWSASVAALLLLVGCGEVRPQVGQDANPTPSDASMDAATGSFTVHGGIRSVRMDDGFEHTGWRCAGATCVQGGLTP